MPTSGSDWKVTNPSQWDSSERSTLTVGSILKDRFVLERVVGKGGMGTVLCARDLRKEEAQDRFPFVAVKILNEDFKRHPESLKLLQREARKAQQLAHPNIVGVYDFDRDGANVFIVMELLEGESLDRIIKRAGTGLAATDALRILTDLGKALGHAHDRGVIHLDFKPANAFICKDGVVKVLDFGIAQAQQREDAPETEQTKFQVGDLGALTPSYATIEMEDGEPPDPRDDVYALACVTYELLTGKHPFGRQSAKFALDYKLWPAKPKGLARHRWAALQGALALRRAERTPTVAQFVAAMTMERRSRVLPLSLAAGVIAIAVGAVIHWQLRLQVGPEQIPATAVSVTSAALPAPIAPPVAELVPPSTETQPQPAAENAVRSMLTADEITQRQRDRLLKLAANNNIASAMEALEELREELPPSNSFVTREGPNAIAAANLRLADRALQSGDYVASADYVQAAQRMSPSLPAIAQFNEALAAVVSVDRVLRVERNLSAAALRPQLASARAAAPASYPAIENNLAAIVADRIQRTRRTDTVSAEALLTVALELFGAAPALAVLARNSSPPEVPNPALSPAQNSAGNSQAAVSAPADAARSADAPGVEQSSTPTEPKAKKPSRPNVVVTF